MNSLLGNKIRVLITDDSSFMRMAIRGALSQDPCIEIVGTAANGSEAVSKALELRPHVITMDVEMPVMDGITAVRKIMSLAPTGIIMISTLTSEGATATFEALDAGAVDFIAKDIGTLSESKETFRKELINKVKSAASTHSQVSHGELPRSPVMASTPPPSKAPVKKISAVAIGASTGGPQAVQEVLCSIPENFPHGIIVGIHMPKAFTGAYARRLNDKCPLKVKEAEDGDQLEPGRVLLAPGGVHSLLRRDGGRYILRTEQTSSHPQQIFVPSLDLMMTSLADACNGAMLGVIMTGMGNDGFRGMQHLKGLGGVTIVQDAASSTIYGMPRACITGGVADHVLPLREISSAICKFSGT